MVVPSILAFWECMALFGIKSDATLPEWGDDKGIPLFSPHIIRVVKAATFQFSKIETDSAL
jgi:hypothetical protein